jgi:hypothetical protein
MHRGEINRSDIVVASGEEWEDGSSRPEWQISVVSPPAPAYLIRPEASLNAAS